VHQALHGEEEEIKFHDTPIAVCHKRKKEERKRINKKGPQPSFYTRLGANSPHTST
jgi:hypothetical protein